MFLASRLFHIALSCGTERRVLPSCQIEENEKKSSSPSGNRTQLSRLHASVNNYKYLVQCFTIIILQYRYTFYYLLQLISDLTNCKLFQNSIGARIFNRYCPATQTCCFCILPRTATIIISLWGLIQSLLYIFFYFTCEEFLLKIGINPVSAEIVLHIYVVTGILLFCTYIILFIAAIIHDESLILLYQGSIILLSVIDLIVTFYVTMLLIFSTESKLGWVLFFLSVFYWIFFYLFMFPVINGFRRSIHTILIVLA